MPGKSTVRRLPGSKTRSKDDEVKGTAASPEPGTDAPSPQKGVGACQRILIVVRPEPHGMVEITVADTGIGIPEQDMERIFEPFVALGEPHGTGLGLTVARHIVEEHGGSLSAASGSDKGARFRIRLPQAEDV
jgi:signal transduction histidine kinase